MNYNEKGLKNLSWLVSFTHTTETKEEEKDASQAGMYTVCLSSTEFFVMHFLFFLESEVQDLRVERLEGGRLHQRKGWEDAGGTA